ncbi:hypothetical protein E3N88_21773 [Mikania micrantha]|uniref:Uncharacterized protein n=1 Tax=Mikania micrantha TaxID=192012 RepID=A0A5N6N8H0_9ASTR|nr:hypothetical protein E3N88_21773 [Mikania micrantha]
MHNVRGGNTKGFRARFNLVLCSKLANGLKSDPLSLLLRVIPGLKTNLIYVDEQGLDVNFGSGKWKVIKGNLVIARGKKQGSLYLVEVPAKGVTVPVNQDKVWFAESRGQKKHLGEAETKQGTTYVKPVIITQRPLDGVARPQTVVVMVGGCGS